MDLSGWEARYQSAGTGEDKATPLLVSTLADKVPGKALDLACGSGRNALWLAQAGWQVTAVDGSRSAIAQLREKADKQNLEIETVVADLQSPEFTIEPERWDLIAFLFYLQPDLFEAIKSGVRSGGLVIGTVHITFAGEQPTAHRLRPGELATYFSGWSILHYADGPSTDPAHKRPTSEIVAQRPPPRQ
jgi:tellurite methyltransferase